MKLHAIAFVLVIIGGLNWLAVGLFNWSISSIFGGDSAMVSRIIFILVGLSAISLIFSHKKDCRACSTGGQQM